jgi:hypothetical protein
MIGLNDRKPRLPEYPVAQDLMRNAQTMAKGILKGLESALRQLRVRQDKGTADAVVREARRVWAAIYDQALANPRACVTEVADFQRRLSESLKLVEGVKIADKQTVIERVRWYQRLVECVTTGNVDAIDVIIEREVANLSKHSAA